jgi:arsenate reductase (glutaredoxin)
VDQKFERVLVYGMPQCKTCQRALDFLQEIGVNISGFRNVKEDKLNEYEIRELADIAGGAEVIFSRRAIMYRALDLDKVVLTDEDKIRHMAKEHTFIRRPLIVVDSKRIYAGFHEKKLRQFFGLEPVEPRRIKKAVTVAATA